MQLITVTFPIIRYHRLMDRGDAAINHGVYERPSDLGAVWIWPDRRMFCPGGIMDSTGLDIPVVDVIGAYDQPKWWKPVAQILPLRFKIELIYGPPKQLSLDEFKRKLTGLVIPMRGIGRNLKAIKSAPTFRNAVVANYGETSFKRFDPPLTTEIATLDDQRTRGMTPTPSRGR